MDFAGFHQSIDIGRFCPCPLSFGYNQHIVPRGPRIENHKQEVLIDRDQLTDRNNSSLGFIFEEAVLLVLLQTFRGKPYALSDAIYSNQPWGSKWCH